MSSVKNNSNFLPEFDKSKVVTDHSEIRLFDNFAAKKSSRIMSPQQNKDLANMLET